MRSARPDALLGVGCTAKQCNASLMKRNSDQITLRLPPMLRASLEAWATQESIGLSALARKLLIDQAARHNVERAERVECR